MAPKQRKASNGKGRLVSQVYEALKRKVITLELQPGEFLDEKVLMEELQVGRTPLRESILRLKGEGLIEGEPNKSSYVKNISLKGSMDLIEALLVVEKSVTFLAAQRISSEELEGVKETQRALEKAVASGDAWDLNTVNQEFHRRIAAACGNEYLYRIHQDLRNEALRLSYLVVGNEFKDSPSLKAHYDLICQHHRAMVDHLEHRRLDGLDALCVDHSHAFRRRILAYMDNTVYP